MIDFWVDGEPAPQGSKKHVGHGRMVEVSKKLPAWRRAVEDAARHAYEGTPIDRPVTVQADFFMPKPAKPKFPIPATAPDTDKLCRALGDCLERAGVLRNDARIVRWVATKRFGDKPGCRVHIEDYNEQETE